MGGKEQPLEKGESWTCRVNKEMREPKRETGKQRPGRGTSRKGRKREKAGRGKLSKEKKWWSLAKQQRSEPKKRGRSRKTESGDIQLIF